MSDKKEYTCPKCGLKAKSSSGWTLHVKTCCPEMRFRKTNVKMLIEFEVPIALDGSHVFTGRQRWHVGTKTPESPAELFSSAFWPKEIPGVGRCSLESVQTIEQTIGLRNPTAAEECKAKRAEQDSRANAIVTEYKRVLLEIIGKTDYKISTETHRKWAGNSPENVTFRLYHQDPANPLHRWDIISNTDIAFTFKHDGTVDVGKGGVDTTQHPRKLKKNKTFELANPKCFESIKKWLKM